jgi:hypothetical protein
MTSLPLCCKPLREKQRRRRGKSKKEEERASRKNKNENRRKNHDNKGIPRIAQRKTKIKPGEPHKLSPARRKGATTLA